MKLYFDIRSQLEYSARQRDIASSLSYDVVDELSAIRITEEQRPAVIMEILHAFQEFPDADWGTPGALVHWLEEPLNYELACSLSEAAFVTRPAPQIAFMLVRRANAARTASEKRAFRELFLEALASEAASQTMVEIINYELTNLAYT